MKQISKFCLALNILEIHSHDTFILVVNTLLASSTTIRNVGVVFDQDIFLNTLTRSLLTQPR